MDEFVVCPNCSEKNPSYTMYCNNCQYMIKRPEVEQNKVESKKKGKDVSPSALLLVVGGVAVFFAPLLFMFISLLLLAACGAYYFLPNFKSRFESVSLPGFMPSHKETANKALMVSSIALVLAIMSQSFWNEQATKPVSTQVSQTPEKAKPDTPKQSAPKVEKIPVIFDGPKLLKKQRADIDAVLGKPVDIQDVTDNQTGELFYKQHIYRKDGIEYQININENGVFDTHINKIRKENERAEPLANVVDINKLPLLAGYPERAPDNQNEYGADWNDIGNAKSLRFMIIDGKPLDMMVDAK